METQRIQKQLEFLDNKEANMSHKFLFQTAAVIAALAITAFAIGFTVCPPFLIGGAFLVLGAFYCVAIATIVYSAVQNQIDEQRADLKNRLQNLTCQS